jgi:hypothetical protein
MYMLYLGYISSRFEAFLHKKYWKLNLFLTLGSQLTMMVITGAMFVMDVQGTCLNEDKLCGCVVG